MRGAVALRAEFVNELSSGSRGIETAEERRSDAFCVFPRGSPVKVITIIRLVYSNRNDMQRYIV